MRRLLTLLPAVVLTVVVPEAQGPPTVAATAITGRVFDARDDAPLRRARVTITIAGRAADPTFTGDDGRFIVGDVPRPPFTLTVAKGGYTPGVLTVSAAQLTAPLQFALTRSVAVMGRVVDGAGIPLTCRRT